MHATPTGGARGRHVERGRLNLLEQLALIISWKWDTSSNHLHRGRGELSEEGLGRRRKVDANASRKDKKVDTNATRGSGRGQKGSKRVVANHVDSSLNPKPSTRLVVNNLDGSLTPKP